MGLINALNSFLLQSTGMGNTEAKGSENFPKYSCIPFVPVAYFSSGRQASVAVAVALMWHAFANNSAEFSEPGASLFS